MRINIYEEAQEFCSVDPLSPILGMGVQNERLSDDEMNWDDFVNGALVRILSDQSIKNRREIVKFLLGPILGPVRCMYEEGAAKQIQWGLYRLGEIKALYEKAVELFDRCESYMAYRYIFSDVSVLAFDSIKQVANLFEREFAHACYSFHTYVIGVNDDINANDNEHKIDRFNRWVKSEKMAKSSYVQEKLKSIEYPFLTSDNERKKEVIKYFDNRLSSVYDSFISRSKVDVWFIYSVIKKLSEEFKQAVNPAHPYSSCIAGVASAIFGKNSEIIYPRIYKEVLLKEIYGLEKNIFNLREKLSLYSEKCKKLEKHWIERYRQFSFELMGDVENYGYLRGMIFDSGGVPRYSMEHVMNTSIQYSLKHGYFLKEKNQVKAIYDSAEDDFKLILDHQFLSPEFLKIVKGAVRLHSQYEGVEQGVDLYSECIQLEEGRQQFIPPRWESFYNMLQHVVCKSEAQQTLKNSLINYIDKRDPRFYTGYFLSFFLNSDGLKARQFLVAYLIACLYIASARSIDENVLFNVIQRDSNGNVIHNDVGNKVGIDLALAWFEIKNITSSSLKYNLSQFKHKLFDDHLVYLKSRNQGSLLEGNIEFDDYVKNVVAHADHHIDDDNMSLDSRNNRA